MGVMKIVDGPRYKKTGSPSQKQQQRIPSVLFAELLPHTTKRVKRLNAKTLAGDAKKLVSLRQVIEGAMGQLGSIGAAFRSQNRAWLVSVWGAAGLKKS
ncbi:MAG TPA: hypothetical protein VNN62_27305 [Methylomirabilota bacterium]|nr:hypothetical protein [Methylomirabilota bacterium]